MESQAIEDVVERARILGYLPIDCVHPAADRIEQVAKENPDSLVGIVDSVVSLLNRHTGVEMFRRLMNLPNSEWRTKIRHCLYESDAVSAWAKKYPQTFP